MNEYIAQQLLGDTTKYAIAKLYLSNKGLHVEGLHQIMVGGVLMMENPGIGDQEMWECEVHIVPRRKYSGFKPGEGYRIDQMLTGGYEKPENWKKKIYEAEADK